ncbi:hypothetical protein [Natrialba taiwanensis]|nr:hypothetical protein [Natrialba taiwanensis]
MGSVSVDSDDKDWFDDFKGGRNQAEAFAEMVQIVKAFEGEPVDHEQLAEELSHTLIPQVEVASYRGSKEYLEQHGAGTESNTGP